MPPKTKERPHISVIVVGHGDSGKSTTIGHMLANQELSKLAIEKLERDTAAAGKSSFKYAWVLDDLDAERERGITMELKHWKFGTMENILTLIDAPGHRDFIHNMIAGASQADYALLVVSATEGEFEAGMGEEGQTREHPLLCIAMGIKQLIVAVNKMDSVGYSEARYNQIVEDIRAYVRTIGINPAAVQFVPISGWTLDNVFEPSLNMPWCREPTFFKILDALQPPPKPADLPFRLSFQKVLRVGGIGTCPFGRVATGQVKPRMVARIAPGNLTAEVADLQMHFHTSLDKAEPGDIVRFTLKGVSMDEVESGFVCGDSKKNPPRETRSFKAQVIIRNHPGQIRVGYTPIIHCHTAHIPCRFAELNQKLDRRGNLVEENPEFLVAGDACIVTLVPTKKMVVERLADYAPLGRIVIRDMNQTVGVGTVKDVEHA